MILFWMNFLFLLIMVMMSIAFYTLLERKMIGYTQFRKGPNKATIMGLIQPMADAMKLLSKEMNLNSKSNKFPFALSPLFNIVCSLTMWMILPQSLSFMKLSILFLMSCMAFNMISIMTMSWAANSNYAYIGMIRTVSQMISYEVNFIMIMIILINIYEQMNLTDMHKMQKTMPMILMSFPLIKMWLITTMAETNRTPFDFSEGESELVSGFNIEYSSTGFMMLFLAEYCSILLMSMISSIIFMKFMPTQTMFYIWYSLFYIIFIWTRTSLPRFRYDKLMKLNWTQILPTTTIFLYLSFLIKLY